MKFDTKVLHAAIKPDPITGSILPPLYQTATYVLEEVGKDKGFDYTRSSNPTRQMMEEHLAALDSGKYGVAYSSGMSAVDSCLKLLKAGDHVICSDDVYGGVSRHFNQILVNYDLHFTYVDTSFPENIEAAEKQRKESDQKLKDYEKIINDAKIEAKNIFNQTREKILRDINNKKESLEKEIDEEINKAEKEILDFKKKSPEKINKIAIETSADLIKQIIGAEVNNSNISAIVEDISKKNEEKYYGN